MNEILKSTSKSEDQVAIEPDGKWSSNNSSNGPYHHSNPTPDNDDDDELVEIPNSRVAALRHELQHPGSYARTPSLSSREESQVPSSSKTASKRPAPEVIDLTLSDDDDVPASKIKRSDTGFAGLLGNRYDHVSFTLPRLSPQQSYIGGSGSSSFYGPSS